MAKIKHPLIKTNKIGPIIRSERTIKKSGGDDFTNNVRCVRLKSKKRKRNT